MNHKTIAILGAGKLGITLAQLALKAGYAVFIAGSGAADKIRLSVNVLAPGAQAVTSREAIAKSDIVVLALPLGNYRTLSADALRGKLVIDAMNYWWEVDGDDEALRNPATSTSEMVQDFLPGAHVVKALSHMGYHHLRDDTRPAGASDRKAVAIASDNPDDAERVAQLVSDLGFDPVVAGNLHIGKQFEPGGAIFGVSTNAPKLRQLLITEA